MPRLGRGRRAGRSLANLLLAIPAFGLTAIISVSAIWLIQQAQSARCPRDTFLAGSGQIATIFQIVPILLGSMPVSFLAINWFVHLLPASRDFFGRNARLHGEAGYSRAQASLAKLSLVVVAVALPISMASSSVQYCLTPHEILYQPWPLTGLRQYAWQDLATVETSCTRDRGGWHGSLFLIMRDGASFDVMAWPKSLSRIYPKLVAALKDVDFTFDGSRVDPRCDSPYRNLLVWRP
jgi:hypothetical protein